MESVQLSPCHDGNCRYIYIYIIHNVHILICHIFKKQQNALLKQKTNHKTHFKSGANSYIPTFLHQGAIIREFINNERCFLGPTIIQALCWCCSSVDIYLVMCNLDFQHFQTFNFYEQRLNYVLDYETLLLINSLMMAPWCRYMLELAPDMKCVLWSVLVYLNSAFCWFFKTWNWRYSSTNS